MVTLEQQPIIYDRTSLKEDIKGFWVDTKSISIFHNSFGDYFIDSPANFVKLGKDGRIKSYKIWETKYPRTDIGHLHLDADGVKMLAVLYADGPFKGPFSIKDGKSVFSTVSNDAYASIVTFALQFFDANVEAVEKQRRWLRNRPWEKLDGLFPNEAILKLEEMGW